MRTIDDFFTDCPPQTLFHYTGIGALLGMVRSKSVWASHAYYLNDSQEILHACSLLRSLVNEKVDQQANDRAFLLQLSSWLDTFRNSYCIFLFSLSEEKSLLSQWRSYTPHGKGVSIGFSPETVRTMASSSGFRLARCIYELDQQRELMEALLEKVLTSFRNRARDEIEHPRNKYFKFLEAHRHDFLQVFAILKHSSFREEREWRVISPYFPRFIDEQIRFREGASMLVPYVELSFANKDSNPGKIFDVVTLGPSPHANLSMSALQFFLSQSKVCSHTSNCAIPYRQW